MTDTQTITYLWSAIILMGGFVLFIYLWLKPVLDAKLKYMFSGGQGTLDIATDGTINLKVQNTNRDDCVEISCCDSAVCRRKSGIRIIGKSAAFSISCFHSIIICSVASDIAVGIKCIGCCCNIRHCR